jgi:hypothetical protein
VPRNILRLAVVVTAMSVLAGSASAGVTRSDKTNARQASRYLVTHQAPSGEFPGGLGTTADAVVSLVAARRAPGAITKALNHVEERASEVAAVGLKAKVVLAAVAGGRDPRSFGGRDLVAELVAAEREGGRIGEGTPVFDHALAMLALVGAESMPSDASARWLASAQCPDGGWQYDEPWSESDDRHCRSGADDDWFRSETDATSYAIQALQVHPATDSLRRNPFRFLRETRDPIKKGWGYSPDFSLTSANSTSLVLQAFEAGGRTFPKGAKRALRDLQYRRCSKGRAGFAFTWEPKEGGGYRRSGADLFATIDGIRGLLERPLPIRYRSVTLPAPRPACA